MTDDDRRLVDLYDLDNPNGPDHDFYRTRAADLGARSILDLGCGTGLLTVSFARENRHVVGVDPSAAMLDVARRRPGSAQVRWVSGDSTTIPSGGFDYAVMTGNVPQHIPDPDWHRTLTDTRDAVVDGAVLAFESRNPRCRAWELWSQLEPTTRLTSHGRLREWSEVTEIAPGQISLTSHNLFETSGDEVTVEQILVFRDRPELEDQLNRAGFVVETVWGGWDRTPFTGAEPIMVFEARAG